MTELEVRTAGFTKPVFLRYSHARNAWVYQTAVEGTVGGPVFGLMDRWGQSVYRDDKDGTFHDLPSKAQPEETNP